MLGEVHGTEANIWALQYMVNYLQDIGRSVVVALELPLDWNDAIDQLNNENSSVLKLLIEKKTEEYQSGRISILHLTAYEQLVRQGVKFYPIREDTNDWNKTDALTAENIHRITENHPESVVLATLGNMHTQKSPFEADWLPTNYTCHPVGELLADQATSVCLKYENCQYSNFETIGTLHDANCKQKLGTDILLESFDSDDYDYKICLYNASSILNK